MDAFLFIIPSRTVVQSGTYKTLYLPEISCKETGKLFLVTTENKMLLQTIRILLNIFFNIFIPLSE